MPRRKKDAPQNNTVSAAPSRPFIIITNDDGIVAPGIQALICALQPVADLLVVAPDGPRSGAACSITTIVPLSWRVVTDEPGLRAVACSGTPVDCAKLAIDMLCEDRRPDLLVSGVNLGNNASVCTFYSGTMGAVTEGCLKGIPSIGFSLDTYDAAKADFQPCGEHIVAIVTHVLANPLPPHVCLNVNFPSEAPYKGLRVCRMAIGDWVKEFTPIDSPRGGNHVWMVGEYKLLDKGKSHDMAALKEGYVSIVPQRIDVTDYDTLAALDKALTTKKATRKTKAKKQ